MADEGEVEEDRDEELMHQEEGQERDDGPEEYRERNDVYNMGMGLD